MKFLYVYILLESMISQAIIQTSKLQDRCTHHEITEEALTKTATSRHKYKAKLCQFNHIIQLKWLDTGFGDNHLRSLNKFIANSDKRRQKVSKTKWQIFRVTFAPEHPLTYNAIGNTKANESPQQRNKQQKPKSSEYNIYGSNHNRPNILYFQVILL